MKYKSDSRVIVREDLQAMTCYGGGLFMNPMAALRGKVVTIRIVNERIRRYAIDGVDAWWTDEMFSGYAEFTLADLRSGRVVETRNGYRYLILKDGDEIDLMNANGEKHLRGQYDNHLNDHTKDFDIMRVFRKVDTFKEVKTTTKLLWERKEPKKMTITEICKELGYDVEIIQECEVENEE